MKKKDQNSWLNVQQKDKIEKNLFELNWKIQDW